MIHWGEIIHEILDCGLRIKSELSSNLWIPHTTKIRLFFPIIRNKIRETAFVELKTEQASHSKVKTTRISGNSAPLILAPAEGSSLEPCPLDN